MRLRKCQFPCRDRYYDEEWRLITREEALRRIKGKPLSEAKAIRAKWKRSYAWTDVFGEVHGWTPEDSPVTDVVVHTPEEEEDKFTETARQVRDILEKPSTASTAEERIAELEQALKSVAELAVKLAQKTE